MADPLPYLPSSGPTGYQQGTPVPVGAAPGQNVAAAPPTAVNSQTKKVGPKSPEEELLEMIRAFFEEMNAPLDMNDPLVQNILRNARQDTLTSANNAGIFGGYSQRQAEDGYTRAAAGLQQQKKGMAMNALGMLTGATQNQRDYDYRKGQDAYQNELDLWKMDQQKHQDWWRNAGGIAGGIVGGAGGAIAGGLAGLPLGPAGIVGGAISGGAAGAQAGYGFGSGVGGQIGGSTYSPPPQWRGGY